MNCADLFHWKNSLKQVFIYIILCMLTAMQAEAADHYVERTGDVLLLAIPLASYAITYRLDDGEGRVQLYKSLLATVSATYALKFGIDKERPDGEGQSFPSGHTSVTFSGASFLQKRYGWKYGAPAYIAASFVGWSRIDARRHYWEDVLAGAAIGIMSSYYFVTPLENVTVSLFSANGLYGVAIKGKW